MVYADDSTFTISDRDPTTLSNKLSDRLKLMADYLTSNKLKVNEDKTHLLVMCTDQRRRKLSSEVTIQAQNHIVRASETERLLGIYIQSNMKWTEHVRDSKFSVLQSLNVRHSALKAIASVASFKSRLTVANGIFMSKLTFTIPLW